MKDILKGALIVVTVTFIAVTALIFLG